VCFTILKPALLIPGKLKLILQKQYLNSFNTYLREDNQRDLSLFAN